MTDLVSIITPSYKCGRFITETIDSVIAQTYRNWEMIIVDDCSDDETEGIVAGYKDSRIKFFRNERQCGAAVSRNRALREAKGRWIAFLDSDDLWDCQKLERQIGFMERSGCSFSYTAYREIDEQSRSLGVTVRGPRVITKFGMYCYCWPGCLTVMYDARVCGPLQITDIRKNNDYAMWLKLIRKSKCYFLDEELASYRKRTGSISNHRYTALIRWHYKLYREADGRSVAMSVFLTFVNLCFGAYKKVRYFSFEQ